MPLRFSESQPSARGQGASIPATPEEYAGLAAALESRFAAGRGFMPSLHGSPVHDQGWMVSSGLMLGGHFVDLKLCRRDGYVSAGIDTDQGRTYFRATAGGVAADRVVAEAIVTWDALLDWIGNP